MNLAYYPKTKGQKMEIDMVCILSIDFAATIKQNSIKDFYNENKKPKIVALDKHAYAFFKRPIKQMKSYL